MDDKDLKRQLLEIAEKMGAEHVCGALVSKGLSPSTADRLAHGTHEGTFKRRTTAIVRAFITSVGNPKAS